MHQNRTGHIIDSAKLSGWAAHLRAKGLRLSLYLILKFLHVAMAIVAVGFNASYPIWFAVAQREPAAARVILRGVKLLDDRFANPAYGLLLVLGFGMVFSAGIPLTTFWIAAALALYVILVLVAVIGYSPTLKRQIAGLESGGPKSENSMRASISGVASSALH